MHRSVSVVATVLCLFAAGCGGSSSEDATGEPTENSTTTTTAAPTTTTTPPTTTAPPVWDPADLEPSVVRILAEGTFIDPQVGLQLNSAGSGSGFIISDDGLVVTNNHVVAGAALLEVWVAGQTETVNARMLGVSECSDLAVIQLEGDGYTPLEWREDPITAGLGIYAAGFPSGDGDSFEELDYTITGGIVNAITANGETDWASIDEVVEHDAKIRGGSSGGPLVDDDGRVVAVNYAGIDDADYNYAISSLDARAVVDVLAGGEDVESIGINGQAIWDDTLDISGIWVASVTSGSPADQAGIEPGDIIVAMENISLGADGTMADYCDILRTHGPGAVLGIEVLRWSTDEVLEGQINGTALQPRGCVICDTGENEVPDELPPYDSYATVVDDSGLISVSLPTAWSQIDGRENPDFGPSLYAATDLEGMLNTWDVPGIILEANPNLTSADLEATLLDIDYTSGCTSNGFEPFEDELYVGLSELWTDCGENNTLIVALAVTPPDGSYVIRMIIQAVDQRDLEAADEALATFVAFAS